MNDRFNKNAKVEIFTKMLGIAVRPIVIDPLLQFIIAIISDYLYKKVTPIDNVPHAKVLLLQTISNTF